MKLDMKIKKEFVLAKDENFTLKIDIKRSSI
jgi:hypothetical protein